MCGGWLVVVGGGDGQAHVEPVGWRRASRRPPPDPWALPGVARHLTTPHCPPNSPPAPPTEPSPRGGDAFLARADVRAAPAGSPLALYRDRRAASLYRKDARQEGTVLELQRLWADVVAAAGGDPRAGAAPAQPLRRSRSGLTMVDALDDPAPPSSGGFFSGLSSIFSDPEPSPPTPGGGPGGAPRGLYMHGGVGTGKTMLMDLFVEAIKPRVKARGWERGGGGTLCSWYV